MEYLVCFLASSVTLNAASKRLKKYTGKILFLIAILIPVLLATFRTVDVGIDVLVYIQPYANMAINSSSFGSYMFITLSNGIEIGYAVLNYIGAVFLGGLSGVFFLSSLLILIPIYIRILSYKNEIPIWVSILVYLLVFYNLSMSLSRQAIALSIIFYALKYSEEKKYKVFFFFVIVAFLFHSSAILGLVYPLIAIVSNGKDWRWKQISVVIGLLFFVACYDRIINFIFRVFFPLNADKYIKAFLTDDTGYLSFWILVINAFIIICVLISAQYLKENGMYRRYLLIAIFNFIIYILTKYNGNCFRYSLYFMIATPEMVPKVRYGFSKQSRAFVDFMVVLVFLLYWINFNLLSDSYGTIPYVWTF